MQATDTDGSHHPGRASSTFFTDRNLSAKEMKSSTTRRDLVLQLPQDEDGQALHHHHQVTAGVHCGHGDVLRLSLGHLLIPSTVGHSPPSITEEERSPGRRGTGGGGSAQTGLLQGDSRAPVDENPRSP